MKQILTFIFITMMLLLNDSGFSQTMHTVEVTDFTFTPSQLTIEVGDTVKWINIQGFHNAVADDNSFSSGTPSSSNWVYTFVFTTQGINPYYCSAHGGPGGSGMSGVITVQTPTDVDDEDLSITKFELNQNYPNPFNPSTTIKYQVGNQSFVSLKVFDIIGNEVANLVDEIKTPGLYETSFKATNLTSGIYFYTLQTELFAETKKMIILK